MGVQWENERFVSYILDVLPNQNHMIFVSFTVGIIVQNIVLRSALTLTLIISNFSENIAIFDQNLSRTSIDKVLDSDVVYLQWMRLQV